jgi:Rod binding protein
MTVTPIEPHHPLNRPAAAPPKTLETAGFQSRLDELSANPPLRPFTPIDNIPNVKGDPHRALGPLVPPAAELQPLDDLDRVPGQRRAPRSEQDRVTAMARKWVAQTFYGTLLRQMRNSPFKSDLFDGGRGGQAFAPMLDQHLIDHMSKGTASKLTGAIARKLLGNRAARPVKQNQTNVSPNVPPGLRA